MSKFHISIDGFWLFIIGIFVILPAIKLFTGDKKADVIPSETRPKVISIGKSNVLKIDKDNTNTPVNMEVKISINDKVVIVEKVFVDGGKPEVIKIKGECAITSFDKTGTWDINMYDVDGFPVDWIRVTVY